MKFHPFQFNSSPKLVRRFLSNPSVIVVLIIILFSFLLLSPLGCGSAADKKTEKAIDEAKGYLKEVPRKIKNYYLEKKYSEEIMSDLSTVMYKKESRMDEDTTFTEWVYVFFTEKDYRLLLKKAMVENKEGKSYSGDYYFGNRDFLPQYCTNRLYEDLCSRKEFFENATENDVKVLYKLLDTKSKNIGEPLVRERLDKELAFLKGDESLSKMIQVDEDLSKKRWEEFNDLVEKMKINLGSQPDITGILTTIINAVKLTKSNPNSDQIKNYLKTLQQALTTGISYSLLSDTIGKAKTLAESVPLSFYYEKLFKDLIALKALEFIKSLSTLRASYQTVTQNITATPETDFLELSGAEQTFKSSVFPYLDKTNYNLIATKNKVDNSTYDAIHEVYKIIPPDTTMDVDMSSKLDDAAEDNIENIREMSVAVLTNFYSYYYFRYYQFYYGQKMEKQIIESLTSIYDTYWIELEKKNKELIEQMKMKPPTFIEKQFVPLFNQALEAHQELINSFK